MTDRSVYNEPANPSEIYNCIVLYLNICIAHLVKRATSVQGPMRKNRFWERQMKTERTVERTEGESALQREGPIEAKDRDWA